MKRERKKKKEEKKRGNVGKAPWLSIDQCATHWGLSGESEGELSALGSLQSCVISEGGSTAIKNRGENTK